MEGFSIANQEKWVMIRRCYGQILEKIRSQTDLVSWVVSGNPGIGKSYFTLFLMQHLIEKKVPFVFEPPITKNETSRDAVLFTCDSNGTPQFAYGKADNLLNDKNIKYYICDGHEPLLFVMAPTILIVSPRPDYWKTIDKSHYVSIPLDTIYMPVWTEEEILEANCIHYGLTEEHVKKLMLYLGPIPRLILEKYKFAIQLGKLTREEDVNYLRMFI
jgi:hypothetical protein